MEEPSAKDLETAPAEIGSIVFQYLVNPDVAPLVGAELDDTIQEMLAPLIEWARADARFFHAAIREFEARRRATDALTARIVELERIVEHVKKMGLEVPDP